MLEPLLSKVKSLKFATEAAITILRIDDLIKLDKVSDYFRILFERVNSLAKLFSHCPHR